MPVAVLLSGGGEPRELPRLPPQEEGLVTQLLAAATLVWEPERHMFAAGTWLFRPEAASLGQPHSFTADRTGRRTPEVRPCPAMGAEGRCQVGEVSAFNTLSHPGDTDSERGELVGLQGPRKDPLVLSGGTVPLGLSPFSVRWGACATSLTIGQSCPLHTRRSSGAAGAQGGPCLPVRRALRPSGVAELLSAPGVGPAAPMAGSHVCARTLVLPPELRSGQVAQPPWAWPPPVQWGRHPSPAVAVRSRCDHRCARSSQLHVGGWPRRLAPPLPAFPRRSQLRGGGDSGDHVAPPPASARHSQQRDPSGTAVGESASAQVCMAEARAPAGPGGDGQ